MTMQQARALKIGDMFFCKGNYYKVFDILQTANGTIITTKLHNNDDTDNSELFPSGEMTKSKWDIFDLIILRAIKC